MTEILRTNAFRPEMQYIKEAAEAIKNGGVVIFPTETVYGIGADAFNKEAVLKVFNAKNRPPDNPLIIHIADLNQLYDVAKEVDTKIEPILKRVWPGPITFIFKKQDRVPLEVTGGLDTVAVRMPAHPVALALIKESQVPIAAPSANAATKPSPTLVEHILDEMMGKVDVILDAGKTFFGIESTILDVTKKPYVLLRPGPFTIEELEQLFGKIEVPDFAKGLGEAKVAIAPGMKYRHYAPSKRLLLAGSKEAIFEIAEYCKQNGIKASFICSREVAEKLPKEVSKQILGSEANLYEIAGNLFDSFRKFDASDAEIAVLQAFPEIGIGFAIMNRARKAAGYKVVKSVKEFIEAQKSSF